MPPRLIVEVVGDTSKLERSFSRGAKQAAQFDRNLRNASRGALAATVSFAGLRRTILSTSAAFLGGVGVVAGLKSTINAAEESERVLGQTRNAVERSGQSWERFGKQVERAALAQSQASGFDDERLLSTFALFERRTKDVTDALRLNALAANVARGANIELEQAAKIVQRASAGQARGLAVLGISTEKGAKSTELLAQITAKFGNSAAVFGNTAAGAQDRFRVALENMQEVLGREALPAITRYLNRGADWLNQTNNQQRVLGVLRSSVAAVKGVVAVLTPIVQAAATVAQKFSDAFGGAKDAVKGLVVAIATVKLASLAASLTAVGTSARGAATGVSLLRTRLLALRAIGPIAIAVELGVIASAHDKQITEFLRSHGLGFLTGGTLTSNPAQLRDIARRDDFAGRAARAVLASQDKRPTGQPFDAVEAAKRQTIRSFGISGAATAKGGKVAPLKARGLDAFLPQQLQLQLAQARTETQQRTAFLAELAVINKKLRGKLAFDDRLALTQERTQILDSLQSMNDAELAARQEHARKIADQAKRAAEQRKQAEEEAARKEKAAQRKRISLLAAGLRLPQLGVRGGLSVADVNRAIAGNEQAAQFRQLGLTATGQERAPTTRGLLRIADQLIGRAEPGKVENRVKAIRQVIVANFKGMSDEVRRTVKGMLDDLEGQLKDRPTKVGFAQASPNKLASLLLPGGSVAERRQLAARLAQIGPGGTVRTGRSPAFALAGATGGITIQGGVHLHGVQNVRELEDNLARRASQRARVRRGAP